MGTPKIFGYVIHTEEEDGVVGVYNGFVAAKSFAEATKFLTETLWENVIDVHIYMTGNGELGYITPDDMDAMEKLAEPALLGYPAL